MNLNKSYNISQDWGWFVDIENYDPKTNYIKLEFIKKNRFNTIKENEYSYIDYRKTQNDIDVLSIHNTFELKKDDDNLFYKVGSTTIITFLLTYFIYFIL